jgi:hypothetical protein
MVGVLTREITGTVSYNGSKTITVIDVDNFYFTATWVSTQTGWWSIVTEGRYNTGAGYQAGYLLSTGSNGIFIGSNAGYRQTTLDNLFIVDSVVTPRASAAVEITNSIIYGVMAATPAAQTLALNAVVSVSDGLIVNEGGLSTADFRAESDTEANMLFLDASADQLFLGGTTNGVRIDKGGEMTFLGTATVFEDVNSGFSGAKVPSANYPSWDAFIGNTKAYTFTVGDYLETEPFEVPHGWKEGSAIEIHVHWATSGLNDATVRGVKWEVEYTWANMLLAGGTTAFGATNTQSLETSIAAAEPTLTHKYTSVYTFTPAGGKVGMYINMRIRRIASVTNVAPANNPFGLAVGIHCECDTVGSKTMGAK